MWRKHIARWWPIPAAIAIVLVQETVGWTRTGELLAGAAEAAGRIAAPVLRVGWPILVGALLAFWLHHPSRAPTLARLRRIPRRPLLLVLASAVVVTLLVVVVLIAPPWFVPDGAITPEQERLYRARNDIRATLLQAVAGIVILTGAYFTYRQVQNSTRTLEHTREQLDIARSGQVTERFTRAIDHLGSDKLDIRLGGIYALARIARDSADDRATVTEVLCAFVREHAPWPPLRPGQYVATALLNEVPALQTRTQDIQAALTVLGRGEFTTRLNLAQTDLRKADLNRADLSGADLSGADLRDVHLTSANLRGADLTDADLSGADLVKADLHGAYLIGAALIGAALIEANLTLARLRGADLTDTDLTLAYLSGADLADAALVKAALGGADLSSMSLSRTDLTRTNLTRADLMRADLSHEDLIIMPTNLTEADLTEASLFRANLTGANLHGANLTGANLFRALVDASTQRPEGFDWKAAGVLMDPPDGLTADAVTEDQAVEQPH